MTALDQAATKLHRFNLLYWAYMDAYKENREFFLLNKRQMI